MSRGQCQFQLLFHAGCDPANWTVVWSAGLHSWFRSRGRDRDGLLRRAYGADPNVLGRPIRIDNDPLTIIGVLPRGFRHPGPTISGDAEVFGAGGFSADPFPPPMRGNRGLRSGIGRLKPGLTLAQAQAQLIAVATQFRHDFPTDSAAGPMDD